MDFPTVVSEYERDENGKLVSGQIVETTDGERFLALNMDKRGLNPDGFFAFRLNEFLEYLVEDGASYNELRAAVDEDMVDPVMTDVVTAAAFNVEIDVYLRHHIYSQVARMGEETVELFQSIGGVPEHILGNIDRAVEILTRKLPAETEGLELLEAFRAQIMGINELVQRAAMISNEAATLQRFAQEHDPIAPEPVNDGFGDFMAMLMQQMGVNNRQ